MIRALYRRALALGVLGLAVAAAALVGVIGLLIQTFSWDHLFLLAFVLLWALFGLMYVVRSRPKVTVTEEGVCQVRIGGWRLAWGEIRSVRLTPSELVIAPTEQALQRQAVRGAVQWSRVFASGQRPRGVIVLPRPSVDSEGLQILRAHGVEPTAERF